MNELVIILFFSIFCYCSKPWAILCAMFLILPYHGFIKEFIFNDGGELFTMWKEIGIVFLLWKTRKNNSRYSDSIFRTFIPFALVCAVFLVIGYAREFTFLQDIRQFIFPSLLMYAISKVKFSSTQLKNVFTFILIGAILIDITGIIDLISADLRIAMRTIMGVQFVIGADGTVYYDISSYKIMGNDRVAGLMSGGPNMMGVFNGVIAIIIVAYFNFWWKRSSWEKILLIIATVLCLLNLMFSFSRAGWALVAITIIYLLCKIKKYRVYIISVLLLGCIVITGLMYSNDTLHTIVLGTISGQEESSAQRASMTQDSFYTLIENPLGGGLGAANHNVKNYLYFAESAIINLGFATGLLGIVLYAIHFISTFLICNKNKRNFLSAYSSGFIIAFLIVACVSVNVVENPFVYYACFLIGLGTVHHNITGTKRMKTRPTRIYRNSRQKYNLR